jgi:Fe2+ or Zn2+ uptake regulation protein
MERKHHFEWNEIKTRILELILKTKDSVNEPIVSEFLQNEYGEFDRSTINKHLHALVDLGCVEQVKPTSKSKFKFYDIKSKNFKSIMNEFPDIKLNEFEKPKLIILNESGYSLSTIEGLKIYIRLLLSRSFFKLYMENDSKTLRLKTWKFCKRERGFLYYSIIDKTKVNYEIMKTEMKTDDLPDFIIIQKAFLKILSELPDDIQSDTHTLGIQFVEKANEKVNELFNNENMRGCLKSLLNVYISTVHSRYFYLLSDHFCFFEDVLHGTALSEELNFMGKTADNLVLMLEANTEKSLSDHLGKKSLSHIKDWELKDFRLMSEIIFNYGTPSIFGTFNSSDEVYDFLQKKYKKELDRYNNIDDDDTP